MESVVGNITQHAGMGDDINPELNELLISLHNIDFRMYLVSRWC